MNAYNRIYLEGARAAVGNMLDYAVNVLGYPLSRYWECFLASPVPGNIELGNPAYLAGKSGPELALDVLKLDSAPEKRSDNNFGGRSIEYWTGWALTYYQWSINLPFGIINGFAPIAEISNMYNPYHEMDIRQFCDRMNEIRRERFSGTNLKYWRINAGISQSRLSEETGIPLRTIQQYEQGRKSINRAAAEYVIRLSRALACPPELLLESE